MINDNMTGVDYEKWIYYDKDTRLQSVKQLIESANDINEVTKMFPGYYTNSNSPEGLYITGVVFDESTNTFTFTFSDNSIVVAKVNVNSGTIDLSKYATKEELNTEINKVEVSVNQVASSLQWKESVPTYDDISTKYPTPVDGWTVNVDDNDITYRFTGSEWIPISANSIPNATQSIDGKMSAEDKRKLDSLTNYDDSLIKSELSEKVSKEDGKSLIRSSDAALIPVLESRLNSLEDKLSDIKRSNVEPVQLSGATQEMNDTTKDYVVKGEVNQGNLVVNGKSAKLTELSVSNGSRVKVTSSDTDMNKVRVLGDYPKSGGNTIFTMTDSEYVTIKDSEFDSTSYNSIEIGLNGSTLPKSVLIDNCRFVGKNSNNSILIFGTQDNAVININNCVFEDVSNVLRISNRTNTRCTINITNCVCKKWDTTVGYQGLILCQDYTTKSVDDLASNNLFSPEKITININNLTTPSGKKLSKPVDMSSICGSGTDDQIIYVYTDANSSVVKYGNGDRYPSLNIL